MKKLLILLMVSVIGLTGCKIKTPVASSSSSSISSSSVASTTPSVSSVEEATWNAELVALMKEHLGTTIPYIELVDETFFFDDYYQEIHIQSVCDDLSTDYEKLLKIRGYEKLDLDGMVQGLVYTRGQIYIQFYHEVDFFSGNAIFNILAGTFAEYLDEWGDDLKNAMIDLFGVVIPVTFTDKSYYEEVEYEDNNGEMQTGIVISDNVSTSDGYEAALFAAGYRYLYSDFMFDYYFIATPISDDKVVAVGVSYFGQQLIVQWCDIPERTTEWNPNLLATVSFYFGFDLPFIELSEFFGASLNTVTGEVEIVDPFTDDIGDDVNTILTGAGFTTDGVVDSVGMVTYTLGDAYVIYGFAPQYGSMFRIGTTAEAVIIDQWSSDVNDTIMAMYGTTIPVAPVSSTHDYGLGTNGEFYISDFRCGDITDEYVAILEAAGFVFVRIEFDGFARYDRDDITVYIQYYADNNVFEIFLEAPIGVISEWNFELTSLMYYYLGDVIPVAPIYNDQLSGFNATSGFIYIMDNSAVDISADYDQILRDAGYLPVDESDLSLGYFNETTGILISFIIYAFGGVEIHASHIDGAKPATGWTPSVSNAIWEYLGEDIPLAPITTYHSGYGNMDYGTSCGFVQINDVYCGDVTDEYAAILADAGFSEISFEEAQALLGENYPSEFEWGVFTYGIELTFYANETMVIAFGYDETNMILGEPCFTINAYLVNPTPIGGGGGDGPIIIA